MKFKIAVAAIVLGVSGISFAQDNDTLEKVKASGSIVLGVKDNTIPLTYLAGKTYTGMQTELCRKFVENELPGVKIRYMSVTAQNRIPLLQNGTVDIVCDATTNTVARAQQVSFAFTDYVAQVRYAVKKSSGIQSINDLKGKNVATSVGTTVVQNLRKLDAEKNLGINLVLTKDHNEGFLLLQSGRVDAYVIDDCTLAGNIANMQNPTDYAIVGTPLSVEPLAIMIRKDDPKMKRAIDQFISGLMKTGEMLRIYNRWFTEPIPPKNVVLNLPASGATKAAYENPNDRPAEAYVEK